MWHFFVILYLILTVPVDAVALFFIYKAALAQQSHEASIKPWMWAAVTYGSAVFILGLMLLIK